MIGDAQPLLNQRVVIVGGTSGMGMGAARAASQAGAEVIALGRRPSAKLSAEQSAHGSITFQSLDMTDDAAVEQAFETLGALDHLLITATPPSPGGTFLFQTMADAQAVLSGKFLGSWSCARHAAPKMRKGGSITFTTGGLVTRPRMGASMMMVAFAALEALTRALALELGPIRVNTIRPGVIDSEMWAGMPQTKREAFFALVRERFPAGRVGKVDDIGKAALFLMTNDFVTGAILEVSGGETLVSIE
ncbi:SDR family oxidoreductase [Mesorhizobium mediterraneum]|uniref:Short-chain dehydrogenase n=1 Tax=Mesorhizobium mediterraneum TaxID=43617 RepID=A0AB36R187_9HYPH|nr:MULTISPECIES: SDR family oxidoreductase [Mesorhizobium]PAP98136.1 short-chain dehydrogenase [Mesorhizobium mediterraneum]RUU34675.1 SDR family oxidoreductase [Mesorhizobium sp. M6A.T.Ce.TU.002.03.1.1]RUV01175.1 SDR family oxidoreductase [Mesorhizobium sp. M6A.T.Cr.TU.017.01.1.1]RVB73325.1 SDR family oxidoreductase [Mesorhizobium sp. M6A.T.Cr.TU.014.01.1.1]RWN33795.1 MAG: SDR family oxidoreductase [Mesorhizobium sp.]